MTARIRDFNDLYRLYRHHHHCLNAARYAWIVSGELPKNK